MDKDRDVLLLSIFTFLTIVLWIVFELVKTVKTTTIAPLTQKLEKPFNPKINMDIVDSIVQRQSYDE